MNIEKDIRDTVKESPLRRLWSRVTDPFRIRAYLIALDGPDRRARIQAAELLAGYRERRAIPGLLRMLDDEAWLVRATAAEALGKIADVHTLPHLMEKLADPDQTVVRSVMWSISRLAPLVRDEALRTRLVEKLMARLYNEDNTSGERQTAAWGLTQIARGRGGGADAVVPALLRSLGSDNKNVRWLGAFTLKSIADPRALAPLTALLEDPDRDVQAIAAGAIEYIASLHPREGREPAAQVHAWRSALLRRQIGLNAEGG